jgi:4-cresol dehydrogenase (hydroxylating)
MSLGTGLNLSYGNGRPATAHESTASQLLSRALHPAEPKADEVRREHFLAALAAWENLLGREHVRYDAETLNRYSKSTLPWSTRPSAVLRPDGTREVSELVKIAARYRIPLHPISRGKNWGYGDACASTDGQVIVDLGRMNRILEVNEELAYAVIEPGVTQGQMYEHLRDQYPSLMLDVTGAGPEASIVGNTLQRGFGHTPYGNHFLHMSGMEVILPDGEVIETSFGARDRNAVAKHVFPWGQGPYLDGLFTQSNLGIVTRMGIWLMPRPEVIEAFALAVPHEEQFAPLIDALRWLKLHDVVKSAVHVANDLRVISAQRAYPWELTGGKTPLPADVRLQLRREGGIGAWNVMGGLYGTRETVAAAKQVVLRKLSKIGRVHFFTRTKINLAKRLAQIARRVGLRTGLENRLRSAESVYDLLCGIPTADHLRGTGWRSKTDLRQADDPNCDVGLAWISPCLPLSGDLCATTAVDLGQIFRVHGFDPLFTFSAITDRAAVCVASINYDAASDRESVDAANCLDTAERALRAEHLIPYRPHLRHKK